MTSLETSSGNESASRNPACHIYLLPQKIPGRKTQSTALTEQLLLAWAPAHALSFAALCFNQVTQPAAAKPRRLWP